MYSNQDNPQLSKVDFGIREPRVQMPVAIHPVRLFLKSYFSCLAYLYFKIESVRIPTSYTCEMNKTGTHYVFAKRYCYAVINRFIT